MAKLVVFRSRVREAVFELRGSTCIVGRTRSCHLQLDDRLISRQHARFAKQDGRWSVEDLQTKNGLYLNEERVTFTPVNDGDVVSLGQHLLVFREGDMSSTEAIAMKTHVRKWQGPGTESTHRLPKVKVEDLIVRARLRLQAHVVVLGGEPRAVQLDFPDMTVGFAGDCDIVLEGRGWLADQAFVLSRDAQEAWFVTALHPLVKVTVNGKRVQQQKLADGDTIGVRKVSIRFHTALAVSS